MRIRTLPEMQKIGQHLENMDFPKQMFLGLRHDDVYNYIVDLVDLYDSLIKGVEGRMDTEQAQAIEAARQKIEDELARAKEKFRQEADERYEERARELEEEYRQRTLESDLAEEVERILGDAREEANFLVEQTRKLVAEREAAAATIVDEAHKDAEQIIQDARDRAQDLEKAARVIIGKQLEKTDASLTMVRERCEECAGSIQEITFMGADLQERMRAELELVVTEANNLGNLMTSISTSFVNQTILPESLISTAEAAVAETEVASEPVKDEVVNEDIADEPIEDVFAQVLADEENEKTNSPAATGHLMVLSGNAKENNVKSDTENMLDEEVDDEAQVNFG